LILPVVTTIFIAGAIGYLLGAIPFGFLVARSRGVNIFEVGSKSPGATNVRRVLGPGPGKIVFVLDVLKGVVAAALPWLVLIVQRMGAVGESQVVASDPTPWGLAGLIGALLGHSFSCFTQFRGGKGVATAAGGLLVLMPWAALIAIAVWGLTFLTARYVSLASMLAAGSLPVSVWLLGRAGSIQVMAGVIAVFVVIRHRDNCRRLLNGTENRFVKKPPEGGAQL